MYEDEEDDLDGYPEECEGCGNTEPEYVKPCPYCHEDKCDACDMGDDVECANCHEDRDSRGWT
jgi:hypothetical protein